MLKMVYTFFLILPMLLCSRAATGQILSDVKDILTRTTKGKLNATEISEGLKQALELGVKASVDKLAQTDGYFGNSLVKIPFPAESKEVAQSLRRIGLGSMVDKAVLSMNRGAEKAAKVAAPIFINAIKSMTFSDAKDILLNDNKQAATDFLKDTTYTQLTTEFRPIIEKSLHEVNATKYWQDVVMRYNKIPFTKNVNPDLTGYVTQKALEGLFKMIAQEELKVRDNADSRTTDLLQKIFGYADKQKN